MTARLFHLVRDVDVTGVSGTGVVAEGVQFSDATVVLRWRYVVGSHVKPTTVVHAGIRSVEQLHGHDGKTRVVWLPDAAEAQAAILRDRASWVAAGSRASYSKRDLAVWLDQCATRIEVAAEQAAREVPTDGR